jgi:hypothetical protein
MLKIYFFPLHFHNDLHQAGDVLGSINYLLMEFVKFNVTIKQTSHCHSCSILTVSVDIKRIFSKLLTSITKAKMYVLSPCFKK